MKKVLFVATVVRLHINMFHQPFLRWFHDQGWQVEVAANNDYEDKSACVIPYCDRFHCLPFDRSPLRKGNWDACRKLKTLLDQEHYDIIHCHTPMGGVAARLAAGSARNRGTKVIYTAHGFHFYDGAPLLNWLLYYPIERLLSRRTDLLITINREDHRRAQAFHAKEIALVNGVGLDMDRFAEAAPAEKQAVREMLGLQAGDYFAISVAQLTRGKNHPVLIEAVARLKDPHFHLFIVGDGNQEQPLQELIRRLGLENQVHLLGFRRDVPRLCSAADLFLFASTREGLPVAVMEAMACGLPIIASNIRGNRDLIDDQQGGFLLDASDVEGFAACIRAVRAHPERLGEMKRHNLERIQRNNIQAVVAEMAALYEKMM